MKSWLTDRRIPAIRGGFISCLSQMDWQKTISGTAVVTGRSGKKGIGKASGSPAVIDCYYFLAILLVSISPLGTWVQCSVNVSCFCAQHLGWNYFPRGQGGRSHPTILHAGSGPLIDRRIGSGQSIGRFSFFRDNLAFPAHGRKSNGTNVYPYISQWFVDIHSTVAQNIVSLGAEANVRVCAHANIHTGLNCTFSDH